MVTLRHLPEFNSFDELKNWITSAGKFEKTIPNGRVYYQPGLDNKGHIEVWYHQTPVVTWYKDKIVLNTGGWLTPTTKRRMNQFIPAHYQIFQENGVWYINNKMTSNKVSFTNRTKEIPYVSSQNDSH